MSFWSEPPDPPHLLETQFFEHHEDGVGGGFKNVEKMTPTHFFVYNIMNLLVFFDFEPQKCFRVPTPWGLYGAEKKISSENLNF